MGAGILQLQNIYKSFTQKGQSLSVLEHFSLVIQPGEFISIVGSSGCGKSTLLRLIAGLDNQFQGTVLLGDQPVVGTSLKRGLVFQEHRLLPWLTVTQNIALALNNAPLSEKQKKITIQEHIDLVKLNGFEHAYPHQLSGGMAQRVAIARGLVNRPDILLLDEPFGALDAITRGHLQQELERIWRTEKITMILVTHDIEEAVFLGNRVVVMEPRPGRIRRIISVPQAHPRDRHSPELLAIKREALAEFGELIPEPPIAAKPILQNLKAYRLSW
ncbi:ABC transporter ATP-binding protein [Aquirhabdus parva]|uniref:ABC transporter ATP-binding protein n=1 Tax=Aquirhabdus parva TaxID=2283318 RepID=A0A345P8P5_9GAMM|nr:ABC transporter ATP-binding protein [Aquirhabdus parva]AXI03654.1 ABC transporter ATP-binding protein [Aquirhabdus parva]